MADLSFTAANVSKGANATVSTGTAGATVTAGQVVYLDTSDTKLKLADAGAQGTAIARGIALHGASDGQPLDYIKSGEINLGSGVTKGTIYILSNTAGGIGTSTDVASGMYVTLIGVGTATNKVETKILISDTAAT